MVLFVCFLFSKFAILKKIDNFGLALSGVKGLNLVAQFLVSFVKASLKVSKDLLSLFLFACSLG